MRRASSPSHSRRDARRPAAHAGSGCLQVAMHVADAEAAGILRLPHFPAVASGFVVDDEPVMPGDDADERQRRVTQLDVHG